MIERVLPETPSASAENTRRSLVEAGLRLFGTKGFSATSTRELAAEAKANVASIAYHFGSKDGLRKAIAETIATTVRSILDAAFDDAGGALAQGDELARRTEAKQRVAAAIERVAVFLLASPLGEMFPRFVLREMAEQSIAFDVLYSGVFEPMHKRLCHLFAEATGGDPESEDTRLTVFAMIGPLLYFRIGAPAVQRRMGWKGYGPVEAKKIAKVVERLVSARLDQKDDRS
jgi:AcrR family transcriptional regulator